MSFYRIRKVIDNEIYNGVDDLFHIPFHLRSRIAPQRFSILGYPSLYLSNSILTCWLEMGYPKTFFASKYTPKEPIALLDISVPNEFEEVSIDWQKVFKFLITYPLIAASTVKVKHVDHSFKSEYVIPQLILQFIRNEKKIDGIIYTSTKISDRSNNEAWNYKNIVIPVLSNKEAGYCEKLRAKFDITQPTLITEEDYVNYRFDKIII